MKRVICFVFLLVVLSSITSFTIYTLNNKGIREEVIEKVEKKIEKVTSNIANNTLTEIYNIYLNKEKHKLKLELTYPNNSTNINLAMYFDGRNIFEENILSTEITSIKDLAASEEFVNNFMFNEESFKIITAEDIEYLLIDVKYGLNGNKEKYYLYNNDGALLTDGDGILVSDEEKYFISKDGEKLNIFYDDIRQIMAKLDNNEIYSLVYKKSKKSEKIEEYKYVFSKGELKKELLNTYDNVKVEVGTTKEK